MILKNFPSDIVNRDLAGALFIAILCSGGLCWGPLGAPHLMPITEGSFPAPGPPADTVCPLSSSTQGGIQHLVRTFCWVSFVPRWAIYHLFCMAGLTGCARSGFPLCAFFCLTVDGKRSESASPFSCKLFPRERNISASDCQTTHCRDCPTYCFFPSFFHVKS